MKLDNVAASIPDNRDFPYVRSAGPFPDDYDAIPQVFAVEDQVDMNLCVTNTIAAVIESIKKVDGHVSRMLPSYNVRHLIENSTGNVGSTLRDGFRAFHHWGTVLEPEWEYNYALLDTLPPPEIYTKALARRVTRYERLILPNMLTWEGQQEFKKMVKSATMEGGHVAVACHISDDYYKVTGPWQTHKMRPAAVGTNAGNGNTWRGNHAFIVRGWNDKVPDTAPGYIEGGLWLTQGSWGAQFADGGFPGYSYVAMAYDIMEAWVVREYAGVTIGPLVLPPNYVTDPQIVISQWYWPNFRRDVTDPMDEGVQYWAMHPEGERKFLEVYLDVVTQKVKVRQDQLNTITPG